jgi:sugar O-acyltransferase (sialic acid O-acetyltransferase NeuD family)
VLLVGAGGHAKAIVEAIAATGGKVGAYVDPRPADWLAGRQYESDATAWAELDDGNSKFVIGLGGTGAEALNRRMDIFTDYRDRGYAAPPIVHPAAWVSASADIAEGVVVLAGAIVQPGARVGEAAIVNTRGVVEHDSEIGPGAHVAPGAVVLGGCKVGRCAMIGAGAVVLPGEVVPDGIVVPAAGRYPK